MTDLPAGTVTVADLYRELVGMRGDITSALTKIEVINARDQDAARIDADHEARLRALERFRYALLGASSLVGILAGALSALIGVVVTGH